MISSLLLVISITLVRLISTIVSILMTTIVLSIRMFFQNLRVILEFGHAHSTSIDIFVIHLTLLDLIYYFHFFHQSSSHWCGRCRRRRIQIENLSRSKLVRPQIRLIGSHSLFSGRRAKLPSCRQHSLIGTESRAWPDQDRPVIRWSVPHVSAPQPTFLLGSRP